MNHPFALPRRTTSALALALASLAACSDGPTAGGPPVAPPPGTVAALACRADVRARAVTCAEQSAGGGVRANIIGGQGEFVRLASTNVAYDDSSHIFSADLTVQNLRLERMGTDGASIPGIRVFFQSLAPSGGSGDVTVNNADGVATFTGSGQPYFQWPGTLGYMAVTAPRRWEWNVPPTVTSFTFLLFVDTPLYNMPFVVFDRVEGGNRDIWRVALDGGDLARVTTDAGDDRDPTVAGNRVVFTTYRHGNAELYSVPLGGGTETRLTTTSTLNETEPALSRDGTRLAFSRAPSGGLTRVYLAASNATGETLATPASPAGTIEAGAAWLNSTRLALTSSVNGAADIFGLTEGGVPTLLGSSAMADVEPAWNATGTRLAFASNRDGDTELYLLDVASGVVTRLTNRAGIDGNPAFLPDGRIAYSCWSGSTPQLCWLNPDFPGGSTVIPTGTGAAQRPAGVGF